MKHQNYLLTALLLFTACKFTNAQTVLLETFDGTSVPAGWTRTTTTGDGWKFSTSAGYDVASTLDHTANGGNYAWIDFSGTDAGVILQSPLIDISTLTVPTLQFYLESHYTGSLTPFNFLYLEAWDGSAWINVNTFQGNTPFGWDEYNFNMTTYTHNGGNDLLFRFRGESGGAGNDFNNDILLDDVKVFNPCQVNGTDSRIECDSLIWIDGNTYYSNNSSATFNIIGGSAIGCDTLTTLNLTINNSSTSTDTRIECDSLLWIDGNTYYANNNSATFNITGGAANLCDSLITLDLTINNSSTSIDTRIECDSLLWIDGNTYYANNNSATFNITGGAANLCDSLITLDLTINNSSTSIDTRIECDSLLWIDGNTYYANNNSATFNITGGAANTCDSLVTLDLIINTINLSITQAGQLLTANENGASYQWLDCSGMTPISGAINQSYTATENGDYAVIVTNNGCSDTSACHTITGVGILENSFGNGLLLYPNPTDGNFSIDLGTKYKTVTVTMTDLSGKLIHSKNYNESQILNLEIEEPAGVYLLMIKSGDKKTVIRLIKK